MSTSEGRIPLTRERIVRTAIELLDEQGEEGFSMRRLAHALGVDPMAVYHHLPNKAAVVHEAIEAVVAECELPDPTCSWPTRVRQICRAIRGLAPSHPGVFPLICVHQSFVPSDFEILEAMLAALTETRLDDRDVVHAASVFLGYASGFALDELTGTLRPFSDSEQALVRGLPSDAFPATSRLADTLVDVEVDAEFEFGLDVIIAGIEARAVGRTPP